MKAYEILFIIKPHLSQEKYKELTDKVTSIITENEGEILVLNEIGMRDLAHEMKKQSQGYYVQVQYKAPPSLNETLREKMRLDEHYVRELIVLMDSIESKDAVDAPAPAAAE